MSRDSREYYKVSTYDTSRQSLPPIRDVVGDVLEQSARSRSMPENVSYYTSGHSSQRLHPNDRDSRTESQLPPMRSRSTDFIPSKHSQTPSMPYSSFDSQQSSTQMYHSKAPRRKEFESSDYSYDVFISTSNQGLVHQRSSHKDDFRQSAKEEAISASTGKHACPECGRRFEKLSHYKNHMNSHSGEKPYVCPWPGCGKTFSASSNMRRHEKSHGFIDSSHKSGGQDPEVRKNKWSTL